MEFVDGRILAYDKENRLARMRHIDYGLGMFRSGVFETSRRRTVYDLSAVYQDLLPRPPRSVRSLRTVLRNRIV